MASNTQFGLDLFKSIFERNSKTNENTSVSPLSVSAALGLLQLGARGTTAEEIRNVLRWSGSGDDQGQGQIEHKQLGEYLNLLLVSKNEGYQVVCANRMYVDKSQNVQGEFKTSARECYVAEPVEVNFQGNADSERVAINSWIAEQTQNKITSLLSEGSISPNTRLVLANALYFKGQWQTKFNERLTRPGPFKVSPGVTKDVPIMRTNGRFPFVQDQDLKCTAVALPYIGADLDMVVILPQADSSLCDLVNKLSYTDFTSLLSEMDKFPTKIYFSVPKFQVTASNNLNEVLTSMGMRSAFFEQEADLSGISAEKDLHVDAVEHKVYVAVDEQGTEAAAATAVVVSNRFSMPPPEVNVDRPFLFAIRDKRSQGSLLFLGAVMDPEAL